jgi:hypothetical protein
LQHWYSLQARLPRLDCVVIVYAQDGEGHCIEEHWAGLEMGSCAFDILEIDFTIDTEYVFWPLTIVHAKVSTNALSEGN